MPNRRWLGRAGALAATALLVLGGWWFDDRASLRGRFNRVAHGMSAAEVLAIMGPPEDQRSQRWPPQVSEYAEVWRLDGHDFVRREHRGLDVHTQIGLTGVDHSVWQDDAGIVLIEYDSAGRVCGKMRLTE